MNVTPITNVDMTQDIQVAEWWLIAKTCEVDSWIQTLTKFEEQNSELQSLPAASKGWEISPVRNQREQTQRSLVNHLNLPNQNAQKPTENPRTCVSMAHSSVDQSVHSWNWHQFQMPKVESSLSS